MLDFHLKIIMIVAFNLNEIVHLVKYVCSKKNIAKCNGVHITRYTTTLFFGMKIYGIYGRDMLHAVIIIIWQYDRESTHQHICNEHLFMKNIIILPITIAYGTKSFVPYKIRIRRSKEYSCSVVFVVDCWTYLQFYIHADGLLRNNFCL